MTTPTANAVPSADPRDLLFNAEKMDEAVNSGLGVYRDRTGVDRLTLAGATALIKSYNVRGNWATATAYATKDVVRESSTWWMCVEAHTAAAAFATDQATKWRVFQGLTAADLDSTLNIVTGDGVTDKSAALASASATGKPLLIVGVCVVGSPTTITVPIVDTMAQLFSSGSQITINNGHPVRPEWFGASSSNIIRAISALPAAGGVIQLENKSYPTQAFAYSATPGVAGTYISKPGVKIVGRKMPRFANDMRSLEGGSIIRGIVLAYADNIEFSNVGIDAGTTVCAAEYGGAASEGLVLTYPDIDSKNAAALKKGARLHNVIALAKGPGDAVHAMIAGEGYTNVRCTGEIVAAYGVHGVAVKCSDFGAESIDAYLNNGEGLVIKSDFQATAVASGIRIGKVYLRAQGPVGWSPHAAATPTYGCQLYAAGNNIDGVQIDRFEAVGFANPVATLYGGSYAIRNIQIGKLTTDQLGLSSPGAAIDLTTTAGQSLSSIHLGQVRIKNCGIAGNFNFVQGAGSPNAVLIDTFDVLTASDVALQFAGASQVDIGKLMVDGANTGVFRILGTPLWNIGSKRIRNTATLYTASSGGIVPALKNSWAQVAANDPFSVESIGGAIRLSGLVQPGSSNILCTLPQWARPLTTKRLVAQANNGTQSVVPVSVGTNGDVAVNEVAGGFANCSTWLSLSGLTFDQQS